MIGKVVNNFVRALPVAFKDFHVDFQLQNPLTKLPSVVRAEGCSLGVRTVLLPMTALERVSIL